MRYLFVIVTAFSVLGCMMSNESQLQESVFASLEEHDYAEISLAQAKFFGQVDDYKRYCVSRFGENSGKTKECKDFAGGVVAEHLEDWQIRTIKSQLQDKYIGYPAIYANQCATYEMVKKGRGPAQPLGKGTPAYRECLSMYLPTEFALTAADLYR